MKTGPSKFTGPSVHFKWTWPAFFVGSLCLCIAAPAREAMAGNLCATSPIGLAAVIDQKSAFLLEPQWSDRPKDDAEIPPGTSAPDGSYLESNFRHNGAQIRLCWGKSANDAIVAEFTSDQDVTLDLRMKRAWPGFSGVWWSVPGGFDGKLVRGGDGFLPVSVRTDPAPLAVDAKFSGESTMTVRMSPAKPLRLVATWGELPEFSQVGEILASARSRYAQRRIAASGDWGGFAQAIADAMNFSRTYSGLDQRAAHVVGRGSWIYGNTGNHPDFGPYFCWDSFFNGNLAVLEDPDGARETIRAVLAYQLPEGLVANYSHWDLPEGGMRNFCSADRSQPPVGAMSVWKMHERWPDAAFLAEVYPKLVRWHLWWPTARDGNHNGLLEWGSSKGDFNAANLETGWDDTPHFSGAAMSGPHMMADAVDLNALWSMDALFLAKIAAAIGKPAEAESFLAEHKTINRRINQSLWNDELGLYCSRLWNPTHDGKPAFLTRITPMNFYPLSCGAPDASRAQRVLATLYRKDKFWGEWLLPTLPYDDPEWKLQHYWRGHVWAPPNWIIWQGLKQYADPAHRAEFARRSVKLFMKHWDSKRIFSECYRSDTGSAACHPRYTWGALLNLIGIESLCDIDEQFAPVPAANAAFTENLTLRNIPFGGKRYQIQAKQGVVTANPE